MKAFIIKNNAGQYAYASFYEGGFGDSGDLSYFWGDFPTVFETINDAQKAIDRPYKLDGAIINEVEIMEDKK